MEIYNYDKDGFYISKGMADESPLEKGVFLIPANATKVKPLDYKDGFDIKFNIELNEFEYVENIVEATDKVELTKEELTDDELQAKANAEAIQTLNSTDWKVIRELERLMLTGTELNVEREALRASVI